MKEIVEIYNSEIKEIGYTNQDMQDYVFISNHKYMNHIWNRELHILKNLQKLQSIVLVYLHRRKSGSEEYHQSNTYDKNEANWSIEENASETIEQNTREKKEMTID